MTEEQLRRLSPSHPAVVAAHNAAKRAARAKQLARVRAEGARQMGADELDRKYTINGSDKFWRELEGNHGK